MNKYKKSIILFAAFFFVSLQAFSQNSPVDEFFNKYANDDRFTLVSVGPQMMSLVGNMHLDLDSSISSNIRSIKSVRILTADKSTTTAEHQQFFLEAINKMNTAHYEELMSVRDKDDNVKCFAVKNNDKIGEIILITRDADSFSLIDITGDIDLNSLAQLKGK
jgi:hypothetical protein